MTADRECDDDRRVLRRVAVGVFALGAAVSLAALVRTWHQPILDAHSFRQTQTAVTAYWIGRGGPIVSYETPVLGAPWSVPFELPLYQAIVAAVHWLTGVHWDPAGRAVSWVFFALALWRVNATVRELGGSRHLGILIAGLVLLSPLYVFWSRTFMIESTALFLSVAFVSIAARHVRAPRPWTAALLGALAVLAALVKVTTFVPFGFAGALVVVWDLRDRTRWTDGRRWLLHYAPIALAGILAIAAMMAWDHHADAIKQDHPFGRNLTSTNLEPWLVGTIAQRLDPQFWRTVVFGRTLDEVLGMSWPLWASLAAAIAYGRTAVAWALVLLVLYLIPFAVFANLHWIHNYYQYANGLFLCCLVAVVAWQARAGWRRWIACGLIALVVASQLVRLVRVEWPLMVADQGQTDTMRLRWAMRDLPRAGAILVFGYDWSAEVAYYARHRAMTVPNWASREQLEALRARPEAHLGGLPVVAVVDCPNPLKTSPELGPIVAAILARHTQGLHPSTVGNCTLWR